jgi:methylated-DNA-[protein]-cysteine S-methyltransferase
MTQQTSTSASNVDGQGPRGVERQDDAASTDRPRSHSVSVLALEAIREDVDPCDVALDAMPGYVAGDLTDPDQSWLRDHTDACGYCRGELHGYERARSLLDQCCEPILLVPLTPPRFVIPGRRMARFSRMESPLGPLLVAVSEDGVCEVSFARNDGESSFHRDLRQRGFEPVEDGAEVGPVIQQLNEYFSGQRVQFDLPVDFSGMTPFTRTVLSATSAVPFGGLSTYQEIARRIGRPKATRAVGNALGRNPIPIIVPCHRIVRSDASIGGYTGGLDIKQHLLSLEGATLSP